MLLDRDSDQWVQLTEEIGPDADPQTLLVLSDLARGHRDTAGLMLAAEAVVRARTPQQE